MAQTQMALVLISCALSSMPVLVGGARYQSFHLSVSNATWSRADLVSKLARASWVAGVSLSAYDPAKDGLLWTGSSWYPGVVFAEGFKKHARNPKDDPGEDMGAWGKQIKDSIVGNSWTYGFHTTTNPRVAAQFGVYHVARKPTAEREAEYECDYYDASCNREVMTRFQSKYGCPANDSTLWEEDEDCYGGPCIRLDKMSDPAYPQDLCPNWGYAYLLRVEGVHVRVSRSDALGKDYSSEEEVFVPMAIEPSEVLGAIPIYARKSDGSKKNPGIINFAAHWNGPYGFDKMAVAGVHTKSGDGAESGIGAFIVNPSYKGDVQAELAAELAQKGIARDIGSVVPREVASLT